MNRTKPNIVNCSEDFKKQTISVGKKYLY